MNDDLVSIAIIDTLEEAVRVSSRGRLADLLAYFNFIQETLIIAFKNGGNLLQLKNVPDNPKLFAFISTARAFSISRIAMDVTIRGYPMEGMALTRTLFELVQCTQYLVRHANLINDYLLGNLKLEKILKMAKKEGKKAEDSSFGRFWGLTSRYSHASPDSIALSLTTYEGNRITVNLVISDPKRIDDTAYGIMIALLTQYLIFRGILRYDTSVPKQLSERDKHIFDPKNIRRFAGFSSMSDQDLKDMYSLFTSENREST